MTKHERFAFESMRFTASVMGNPDYIEAVKHVKQAPDERAVGIEKLNSFHARRPKKENPNGAH